MKQYLLAASLLLAGATAAQAQVRSSIGPQVGYTLFTVDSHDDHYKNSTGYRSNFSAGLLAEFGVDHLSVQAAPRYTRKGYSFDQPSSQYASPDSRQVRLDYVTLPLSIGYTQHKDGQGFQVFGGAYLGYFTGGHYVLQYIVNGSSSNISGPVTSEKDANAPGNAILVRHLDWGVQGGIGYRYQHLLLQVEYQAGLQNVNPTNFSGGYSSNGGEYYNRGFQASLAYLFGSKY
jgi:hypothetical protein